MTRIFCLMIALWTYKRWTEVGRAERATSAFEGHFRFGRKGTVVSIGDRRRCHPNEELQANILSFI